MLQRLLIQKKGPHEIAKITEFLFLSGDTCRIMVGCRSCTYPSIYFFHGADSEDHGRLPDELISKHSLLTVLTRKITVGCPWRTYPSIHAKTCADSHDHGRLPVEHVSKHAQKLAHVLASVVRAGKKVERA